MVGAGDRFAWANYKINDTGWQEIYNISMLSLEPRLFSCEGQDSNY